MRSFKVKSSGFAQRRDLVWAWVSDLPFTVGEPDDTFVSGGAVDNLGVQMGDGRDYVLAGRHNDQVLAKRGMTRCLATAPMIDCPAGSGMTSWPGILTIVQSSTAMICWTEVR